MAAYRRVDDLGHLQADCYTPGSSPVPTLGIEYGKPLPFYLFRLHDGLESNKQPLRVEGTTVLR